MRWVTQMGIRMPVRYGMVLEPWVSHAGGDTWWGGGETLCAVPRQTTGRDVGGGRDTRNTNPIDNPISRPHLSTTRQQAEVDHKGDNLEGGADEKRLAVLPEDQQRKEDEQARAGVERQRGLVPANVGPAGPPPDQEHRQLRPGGEITGESERREKCSVGESARVVGVLYGHQRRGCKQQQQQQLRLARRTATHMKTGRRTQK